MINIDYVIQKDLYNTATTKLADDKAELIIEQEEFVSLEKNCDK